MMQENLDLLLLENRPAHDYSREIFNLKAMRPDMPFLVVGASRDDESGKATVENISATRLCP